MSKDPPQPGESAELRLRAERRLAKNLRKAGPTSPAEKRRLLHELRVHQIELEMQNEELLESRTRTEAALERYTDLYDFAPVGYFTFSPDGAIREVNLPGARLLGLERALVVGSRFGTFVSESTRPLFETWLEKVFSSQVKQTCVVALIRKGSSPLAVEIEATLSLDGSEGRAVVVDISARKALEEQLRQAQKMEVVGQLAGGVAHDFNNILAAMILKLEMLQIQHNLPEAVQVPLNDLDTLAKRAASLTRQLLLFSRQQAMHPEPLEVNATLTHLLKMLERLLGEDIACRRLESAEELWVEGDVAMLDQVVMNLCVNARDAMPRGGTLTLETSLVDLDAESLHLHPGGRSGRFVCVRISDTGCGMDALILRHLFEPFFTTKEVGKGTGLGLASAYGIMHQHKGWISVDSTLGQGSSFQLYLPFLERAKEIRPAAPQAASSHGRTKTILLVEDEADLLLISAQALTMFGYRVLSATDGQEALNLWEQHRDAIDLVLTDMRMPKGVNGLELADKLRKAKPSLRIIIMSGYSMETAKSSPDGNFGYAFLAKPFDLKTLSETVRHCLS